jgi:hypothetical protein
MGEIVKCLFCHNNSMAQLNTTEYSPQRTIEHYSCPCGANKVVTMSNFAGCDYTCDAEHFFNNKPAVPPKYKNAFWNPAHIVGIVPAGEPIPGSAECSRKYFPHTLRCVGCCSQFVSATPDEKVCPICINDLQRMKVNDTIQ